MAVAGIDGGRSLIDVHDDVLVQLGQLGQLGQQVEQQGATGLTERHAGRVFQGRLCVLALAAERLDIGRGIGIKLGMYSNHRSHESDVNLRNDHAQFALDLEFQRGVADLLYSRGEGA